MKNVLVLGANGQIARWVVRDLAARRDIKMKLLVRDASRLTGHEPENATVVIGNVLDKKLLRQAMAGQDVVYANLTGGDVDKQAQSVIAAMQAEGVERLIFVLSLGIYDEVPGKFGAWNEAIIGEDLKPFRRAAHAIEASGLAYTILRPAWLTDEDEVDYETTSKGQAFKGTVVSRKSVADLIGKLIASPDQHVDESLGVNKPGSDADKPYFM
ncbi:SDR family oxidoreductase [Pandoraea sputorum]|uniref:SDR family oxidoreductase n=1 Tax=Pandoraea sputorum TaxID=93222 RepID=UPI001E2D9096|nr:SDR family oxidoreductase [Pandoraea sputorum]MCE4060359.1 SDR family oxidoreductase [Pandoraea sputorum]